MLEFIQKNYNPAFYVTGDCATQVICSIGDMTWAKALEKQYFTALKLFRSPVEMQVLEDILVSYGYTKVDLPEDGEEIVIATMDEILTPEELANCKIVCITPTHCAIINNGYYYDVANYNYLPVMYYYIKHKD